MSATNTSVTDVKSSITVSCKFLHNENVQCKLLEEWPRNGCNEVGTLFIVINCMLYTTTCKNAQPITCHPNQYMRAWF